jgi:hypothetical protein
VRRGSVLVNLKLIGSNRGELARGWYERIVKKKSGKGNTDGKDRSGRSSERARDGLERKKARTEVLERKRDEKGQDEKMQDEKRQDEKKQDEKRREREDEESSDEEVIGPFLPGQEPGRSKGPAIPSKEDLELQKGNIPSLQFKH